MPKFCSECGYKLDAQYKFCPNCGAEVNIGMEAVKNSAENPPRTERINSDEVVICQNCGEENPAGSSTCQGCGVKLENTSVVKKEAKPISTIQQKPVQPISGKEKKKSANKKEEIRLEKKSEEKHLDTKKLMIAAGGVLIVVLVILYTSGVFDTGIEQNTIQNANQDTNSGVSLANVNAINDLENKVKANPSDKQSTVHLANLLQDSKFFDRAVIYYKKYLEMEPKDINARVDLGICYYNLKDYQNAIKEMETAVKSQPNHQVANLNLGIVNLAAGNLGAARDWFSKTVNIDPNTDAGKKAQELLQSHLQNIGE